MADIADSLEGFRAPAGGNKHAKLSSHKIIVKIGVRALFFWKE